MAEPTRQAVMSYTVRTDTGDLSTADYLAARDFLADHLALVNPRDDSPTGSANVLMRNAELAPGTERDVGKGRERWASVTATRA